MTTKKKRLNFRIESLPFMVSIPVDENIVLRSYTLEDAGLLFDTVNKDRLHLHPWLEWVDKTTRPEHSLQFIQEAMHLQEVQEALALGIFFNDELIGGAGMHDWEGSVKKAQIGYWVRRDFEGQGIITRCLQSFLAFLFDRIGLNKVEIHFLPVNKRSAKVANNLGFKTEGIIRQSAMRNGMPEDVVITGLLKSEWKELCKDRE